MNLVEIECAKGLIRIRPILEGTGKPTIANELGEFQLQVPKQPYTVIAIGRVGMNAALWVGDLASDQSVLKLARPTVACYDPSGVALAQ
jgi:hypothetical protein